MTMYHGSASSMPRESSRQGTTSSSSSSSPDVELHFMLIDMTARSQPSGTQTQATALRAEGVEVTANAMGELSVDFATYGWFPRILPSEGAADDADESTESGDHNDD